MDDDLFPIVSLDLRAIRTVITEDEGDPILLIDDGDVQIEFSSGLCGTWEQAILGAERIATAAEQFAAALRAQHVSLVA
jgi:hypothetical protein